MTKMLAALVTALAATVGIYATAWAHEFDHPAPSFSPQGPPSSNLNAGGEDAEWELVGTIPTGNPHTDLDFFSHAGETYASVGTLADGPNAGGQTIIQLTDKGAVKPKYVAGHPSASCVTTTGSITGLQHDAEATPKGGQLLNTPNPVAAPGDAQLLVDSSDANGRCHDQGVLGQQAPRGGLELIDITDPGKPKEIGLTVHVGEAHTVNIDPKRPHIAIVSSSDTTDVGSDGKRTNETSGNALDGIEVVDMSSCMNFPAGTTIQQKRDACSPQVYRYRFPQPEIANSHSFPKRVGACHETEIYPDDTLVCASLFATAMFDLKGAFDDRGTPNDFTDDKPRGTPLPCNRRPSSTAAPTFRTGAMVIDCQTGQVGGAPRSLTVSEWLKIGAPSLEGVQWKGTVHHMGFENQQEQSVAPPFDSTQDIFVSHEAELTNSRKFVLVTDERGGGVLPGGATCSPGADNKIGNGGIHAFPVGSFKPTGPPSDPKADQEATYAKSSNGQRAVYRANIRTIPQASVCTSHVLQQIPGQNRIFMAWYSQGTQVVDFVENRDGTIDFKQAGWFTPEGANEWVSAVFKAQRNADGSYTYWGATGDFALSGTGRKRDRRLQGHAARTGAGGQPVVGARRRTERGCLRQDRGLRWGVGAPPRPGHPLRLHAAECGQGARAAAACLPRTRGSAPGAGQGLRPAQPRLQLEGRPVDPARLLRRGVHDEVAERPDRQAPGGAAPGGPAVPAAAHVRSDEPVRIRPERWARAAGVRRQKGRAGHAAVPAARERHGVGRDPPGQTSAAAHPRPQLRGRPHAPA